MDEPLRVAVPRIESIKIKNYRVLRDLELNNLTPLTVFLGPNGSGKSTIFDVFAFLSECFTVGLRKAWDRRGRFEELFSRNATGDSLEFEIKYRERKDVPIITYHLEISERGNSPVVSREWMRWKRGSFGAPFYFLDFTDGVGTVVSGDTPDDAARRQPESLESPEVIAVSTLGQLAKHPRVSALRRFITGWYLSYLNADDARNPVSVGAQERLSVTGDNLPNVIQYLMEQHPQHLENILQRLAKRVPQLERFTAESLRGGTLLLQLKDTPFDKPILAKYASDGTLKLLAYLTILFEPFPPPLIGIEEPENQLHPRLLYQLSEECRNASARSQLMVTTHSPFFVDALRPHELWVLYRTQAGYTQARRASDMQRVMEMVENGAALGDLWMEGHFEVGDPLVNEGRERSGRRTR